MDFLNETRALQAAQTTASRLEQELSEASPMVTNELSALTPDNIKTFAEMTNGIIFPNVTAITPEAAEGLTRVQCRKLSFPAVKNLNVDAAMTLAPYKGGLLFDGLTELSDDLAETLSAHIGDQMSLAGVTKLTVPAAEAFANYGGGLNLSSIYDSTKPEAIHALALFQGTWLDISNIKHLEFEALLRFSASPAELFLNDGLHISTETAVEVVSARLKSPQDTYLFNDIIPLPPQVLLCFADHDETMVLPGITSLDVQSADALSHCTGMLDLPNLHTLSEKTAEWLRDAKGALLLDGLYSLDEETARALSPHESLLSLTGVEFWEPDALRALIEHTDGLALSFPNGFSEEIASILARNAGSLFMLDTLWQPDEALRQLMWHENGLYIDCIPHLSLEMAEILATYQGEELIIQRIDNEEEGALDALNEYTGTLVLPDEMDD